MSSRNNSHEMDFPIDLNKNKGNKGGYFKKDQLKKQALGALFPGKNINVLEKFLANNYD